MAQEISKRSEAIGKEAGIRVNILQIVLALTLTLLPFSAMADCQTDPFSSPNDIGGQQFSCDDGSTGTIENNPLTGPSIQMNYPSGQSEEFTPTIPFSNPNDIGGQDFSGSNGDELNLQTLPY